MEHHWAFNVYRKHTIAERSFDALFFKHKYLTSSIVTPEDTVREAAKVLIEVVTDSSNKTKFKNGIVETIVKSV